MQRKEKGEFAYLKYKKAKNLILTIIAFTIVFAILVAGILIFKSKTNYLTVLSVVLVLPSAKFAVSYFILLSHKSCDEKIKNEILSLSDKLPVSFDLVVSNSKTPIGTLVIVNSDNAVLAYTTESNAICSVFEESVKEFLKNDKLNATVTLYKDYNAFKKRVENVNINYDSDNETLAIRTAAIKESLLIMSL